MKQAIVLDWRSASFITATTNGDVLRGVLWIRMADIIEHTFQISLSTVQNRCGKIFSEVQHKFLYVSVCIIRGAVYHRRN